MALSYHTMVRLEKYLVVIFLLNLSLLTVLGFGLLPVNAQFSAVTMTVSYQVEGSESPKPVFNYVLGGSPTHLLLTQSPEKISVDKGSSWSVMPNPLLGSSSSERWYSSQTLTGTATATTIVFTFQHQYHLTMAALIMEPTGYVAGGGTLSPIGGWYNADTWVTINASANPGYKFLEWINGPPGLGCLGQGGYCGTNPNPPNFKITTPITENAIFADDLLS